VAAPATDAEAASALVARLRREHHDARHVCSAWRLGPPGQTVEARHDDGEPAGTGGEPILAAIRAAGLTDVAVAVVRHFGGIKLGTGGLGRAYGGVAQAALAAAPRRAVRLGRRWCLVLPYHQQKTLQRVLVAHEGETEATDYAAAVTWTVWLPRSRGEAFVAAVREATAGRVEPQPVPGPEGAGTDR
jgi:uncharacterized YigZ family protein